MFCVCVPWAELLRLHRAVALTRATHALVAEPHLQNAHPDPHCLCQQFALAGGKRAKRSSGEVSLLLILKREALVTQRCYLCCGDSVRSALCSARPACPLTRPESAGF